MREIQKYRLPILTNAPKRFRDSSEPHFVLIGEHLAGNHFVCLSIGEHLAGNHFRFCPSASTSPAYISCVCPSASTSPAIISRFVRRRTIRRHTFRVLSIGELFAGIHFMCLSIGELFAGIHFSFCPSANYSPAYISCVCPSANYSPAIISCACPSANYSPAIISCVCSSANYSPAIILCVCSSANYSPATNLSCVFVHWRMFSLAGVNAVGARVLRILRCSLCLLWQWLRGCLGQQSFRRPSHLRGRCR